MSLATVPTVEQQRPWHQEHSLRFLTFLTGCFIAQVVLIHLWVKFVWYGIEPTVVHAPLSDRLIDTFVLMFPVSGFVFVAGFRFQYSLMRFRNYLDSQGRFLFRKYAQKRFNRLIVPYLAWTAIYLVLLYVLNVVSAVQTGSPVPPFYTGDIGGLITGLSNPAYQLWFMPMLFAVSLTVVFLRYVVHQPLLIYGLILINLAVQIIMRPVWDDIALIQWLIYPLVFEFGIYYGKHFFTHGTLPYSRLIVALWLAVLVVRVLNRSDFLFYPIEVSDIVLTPMALSVIIIGLRQWISERNILYAAGVFLGIYSGAIYILHEPIILSYISAVTLAQGWLHRKTLIPITAFCILICILLYRMLLRVVPSIKKIML